MADSPVKRTCSRGASVLIDAPQDRDGMYASGGWGPGGGDKKARLRELYFGLSTQSYALHVKESSCIRARAGSYHKY